MGFQGILEKIIVAHLFPVFCVEPEGSLPCSQEPALLLVLLLIQSMLRHPMPLKSILILSFDLCLLLSPKWKYSPQLFVLKTSFYILGMWTVSF
jgi:hypothetical protein